jgi:16S rRNA (guanine527-N7)-methyltransferase
MGEVLGNQVSASAAVKAQWEQELNAAFEQLHINCDERTAGRIARYHEMLADWNTRMNLTGDTEFATSLDRHYTDSLAPLANEQLFPEGVSLIDVGSGAGFPGLPLAIARPDLKVTLLDSLMKRIHFLAAVVEELGLTNVKLVHARAEDGGRDPACRAQFDIAVARAVAPLPVLCELLLPFVKTGGRMICYKGPSAEEEWLAGEKASVLVGGGKLHHVPVALPSQPEWQHCLIWTPKEKKTVRQYPRKAGTPSKSPLGANAK